jgi:hypothetical protein
MGPTWNWPTHGWMNNYDNSVSLKVRSSVERVSTFEHTRLLLVWGVFVFPVFGIVGIVYILLKNFHIHQSGI